MTAGRRVLLIGYGNPGRGDDGLGPALAEALAADQLDGLTVEADYQLTVDHAEMIAAHDLVVFADAMIGLDRSFRLTRIASDAAGGMGSHQVSPPAALALAGLLFGAVPEAFVLAIAGQAFGEVKEGLSAAAADHLEAAEAFLRTWVRGALEGKGLTEHP